MRNIKKLHRIVYVILISILTINNAFGYDFYKGGIYYTVTSTTNNTCSVSNNGSNSYFGEVIIPEQVLYQNELFQITSIANGAFNNCSDMTKIVIPKTITQIGSTYSSCFDGCTSLKEIVFEDGECSLNIGYGKNGGAFFDCPLDSLYLGRNLEYKTATNYSTHPDVYSPFAQIKSLRSVYISESVKILPHSLFYDCIGLTSIYGMKNVTTIETSKFQTHTTTVGVFQGCKSLKSIVVPDNVVSIGDHTFEGCTNLENVILGNSITGLGCSGTGNSSSTFYGGIDIFHGCNIKNLYIGKSLEKIGNRSFASYNNYVTIQNLFLFSENNIDISLDSNRGITNNTNIYVIDPTNYTTKLNGFNVKPLLSFDDDTYAYSEGTPKLRYVNNVKNSYIAITSLNKNVGKHHENIDVRFYLDDWSIETKILSKYTIIKASQSIEWNQTFPTVYNGDQIELNAVSSCGLPISYTTSNADIAFVSNENGKAILHLLKDGIVQITATQSGNNNYEAATSVSKALTITPRAAIGISLNCSTTSVKEGNSVTLTAKLSPETVIEKKVKWTTSDATVAIVDNGIVTGIKVGTATITATTIDGSNLTASCLVNVVPVMVESISLSKSAVQLVLGNSERISAIVLPSNATNKSIRWEVDNSSIASVNDGVITALGIGNTTIKSIANDGSGVYATCSVVVNPIAVSSIELSPITGNVDVGGNITLTATVYPTNASNKQLMWQSSNNDVATVINGIVTGIKPGNVIITAKATDGSNKTATASITVNKIKASNINLNKTSVKLFVGDEETIIATISPSDATIKDVTWSTSNANVATVVNGLVTARGSGTATITAVTTDGTNISATCDVTVNKRTQSILWNQYLESIQYGGQLVELIATASSGLKVKYKSNDDNVVSIFDLGDIVYLNPGNVGKTSVVAYQEGNNEYLPTETTQNIEVVNNSLVTSKTLIAYYSQSALMDGIVAELANQITGSGSSVYTQKIEPTNNRINEANTNREVRDSVMNVIGQYPNDVKSYPPIKSIGVNVNDYDDVIMVYPLWNSMMAAPLQTFSFTYSDALKKKSVAYIEYDLFGDAGASSNAKALRLNAYNIEDKENIIKEWLRNSEATGLLQLHKDRNRTVEGIYDLQGRKVSNVGEHGLYIIKGKKIIVE